jgi:serine/threonine protein kinase
MPAVARPFGRYTTPPAQSPGVVRDLDGIALELEDEPVGRGGQGIVYRVRNSRRYAVKLVATEPSSRLGDSLAERLARLQWLPLEGIPITRPLKPLAEPHVGYIMELLDGMIPIASLAVQPESDATPVEDWYRGGGGLRRRLRLLSHCAAALAKLHGRGIVYGDIAPTNVLLSPDVRNDHVWLIDPDNLAVESSARRRTVWTDLYRAPELVRGQSGNTPFSDVYSFAILAYQTLRTDHPLIGDYVYGDSDLELEVQRGDIPWTGHRTDDRNRSECGLREGIVLTNHLKQMFARNFEEGLSEPFKRPEAAAWADELAAAAELTVSCRNQQCGHTYFVQQRNCPFCGSGLPEMLVAVVRERVPSIFGESKGRPSDHGTGRMIVFQDGQPRPITARTAEFASDDPARPCVDVRWEGGRTVSLRNRSPRPIRLVTRIMQHGSTLYPDTAATEPVDEFLQLHFGEDRQAHRFVTFHLNPWKGV